MSAITLDDVARVLRYRLLRPFGTETYTPFILLSRSRAGSNLLNSSLGSHPNVHVKGEHFGHLRGDTIEKRHRQVFGKQPRWIMAAGCKVFYYHPHHGDPRPLFDLLKSEPRLKVIHLKRLGKLRSVLSWMIARENNTYVATSSDEMISAERKRLSVDPDELIAWIEKTIAWESWGDSFFSDRDVLNITYEDLVRDMQAEYARVLDYLDLPSHVPYSVLKRQNPEPAEQLISNWPEVRRRLEEEGYDDLLTSR